MTTETASNSANGNSSKVTPQLKHRKPPRRKMSPINWFPRKKVDSYLNRKIKMLQEVDGMKLTLDQTLHDSNPHYCLVLREKMAAKEAAHKAMEARRAALVEASWCRILRAARISSDDAEAQLSKAEKNAEEAFEAAQSMGVIMYDLPNCGPGKNKHCQIESFSVNGEGSSTHTVTASFETAFDVDKEVAAAVKAAFVRLSNCHSFNKDEFRELLRLISENPDAEDDKNRDLYEFSSEYESESGSELEKGDFTPQHLDSNMPFLLKTTHRKRKGRRRQSLDKFSRLNLVDMMLERLKCLQEDELSSLATIVATCGLNAALAQVHNSKLHNSSSATDTDHTSSSTINFPARRMSLLAMGKKQVGSELPSLDKFLVKHMTKLEREVQEAKNKRRNETESDKDRSRKSVHRTPSETINEVPGLDKFLVKHVSRLEKEVQEAKNRTINEGKRVKMIGTPIGLNSDEALEGKENINITSEESNMNDVIEENKDGLDKILIKPVHRLEKEKMHASSLEGNGGKYKQNRNQLATGVTDCESLDKILVKHVSRLEKEKMRFKSTREEEKIQVKKDHKNMHLDAPNVNLEGGGGLEQILLKHKPRLEREKMAADQAQKQQEEENPISVSMARRAAREKELQQTWGGLSLGTSIKPHLSKLERDKAAWIKAEEEERRQAMKASNEGNL